MKIGKTIKDVASVKKSKDNGVVRTRVTTGDCCTPK